MDDVILLTDSDEEDSDVELVGCYSNAMTKADPLPLSSVRVDVDAVNVNVPKKYIDLTDPKWTLPELKIRKRPFSTSLTVVDLTDDDVTNETKKLPPDDDQIKTDGDDKKQNSNKNDNSQNIAREPLVVTPQQDCGNLKPKQSCIDLYAQHQKHTDGAHEHTAIKKGRLSFVESHVTELKTSKYSIDQVSLRINCTNREPECINSLSTANPTSGPNAQPSLNESPLLVMESEQRENSNGFTSTQLNTQVSQHPRSPATSGCADKGNSAAASKEDSACEDKRNGYHSAKPSPCLTSPSSQEVLHSNVEPLELEQADLRQNNFSDPSPPDSPSTRLNPSEPFDLASLSPRDPPSCNLLTKIDPTPTSEDTPAENMSEWQSEDFMTSNNADFLGSSSSKSSLSKTDYMDERSWSRTCINDPGPASPGSILWQECSDVEQVDEGSDKDNRAASREDRHFVCPVALSKIMSGSESTQIEVEDESVEPAVVICPQSLSLVYSTIEENYTEGTLQLLSDLIQPGYYPPRDITLHLLQGILLDPQCRYHLCVQAFNLLIRTQRHHMADQITVPWDWDLLTSVMAGQAQPQTYRCEVVRMLLEYIVQTLEDDFQAKSSTSAIHHSIAKATLSCDKQFPNVRDVIKWLFSAILKSTEPTESREETRARAEHIRMVSIFQRILTLALEVDRSPALISAKLSLELFHMLIGCTTRRAHRMMLLESLQSKLLRCKVLGHLLEYACPVKTSLPLSLSLLLHFMKNCTLQPDSVDGTEKWHRWEELVHLLWMLLLSYNKAMKGCLYNAVTEQRSRVGTLVYKQDDMVSKAAVREAVEAFLSRARADLGQALPLHVEESLTYLQDHLLDIASVE